MCSIIFQIIMNILYLLCGISLIILIIRRLWINYCKEIKNVCIVVFGDLGRSPRMQYHALSFAKEGFNVDFIGYPGTSPLNEIKDNPRITIHYLSHPPSLENTLPIVLHYIVKVLWQSFTLTFVLFSKNISNYILIQNPPAIPTIPICWFFCILSEAKFIIDWHNYAHSLMALNLGKDHVIVNIAKFIEMYFGIRAHYNFCVTKAMKGYLQQQWGIEAHVLYDRPASYFKPISLTDKHEFLLQLSKKYEVFRGNKENSTIFTESSAEEVNLLSVRPGFIISSTSWTEDEDFTILINALQEYENDCDDENADLPDLICVITGKGPLKEFYTAIIKLKKWKHVTIVMPWLENEEYPKMLASADLGICLHISSSGSDLPMKVVDMFGCGLPVCAYNFTCLSELVKHDENGYVFSNEKELAAQLKSWFLRFPINESQKKIHKKFQNELCKFQEIRWHDNWSLNVVLNNRPIIGILSQELNPHLNRTTGGQFSSYIASSYVKFVEGAGARVVPIWIGKSKTYYENILRKLNGVLWPGGATFFNNSKGYAEAGYKIYRIAEKINEREYFPILGICLGFELLTYVAANKVEHRINCSSQSQALHLNFNKDYRKSRLFKNASSDIINILKKQDVTINFHNYCIIKEELERVKLNNTFRIISQNVDKKGTEFISSLEHFNRPFYGLQFHPEKNIYEWISGKNIPHTSDAIKVSQYFANFFVNEARKNNHAFTNSTEEAMSLIYNYQTYYMGIKGSSFQQIYLF
ncbi:chitobiosyldiphosphodolichol beta-mannosyltransferase-like [Vespa crabro]|uniref:chitobiosyldiphosphodolichol beta-mannosyltransferase-like n=1 Tax=Vespa crabro TaxID=7445 RepID=UPI001F031D53|nr:chitobiosyldiphosphodolichol beta-mannosyltransferase-like [Vespa crabro]